MSMKDWVESLIKPIFEPCPERTAHLLRAAEWNDKQIKASGYESAKISIIEVAADRALKRGRNEYELTNGSGTATAEDWVLNHFNDWKAYHFENYGLKNLYQHLAIPPIIRENPRDHAQYSLMSPKNQFFQYSVELFSKVSTLATPHLKSRIRRGGELLADTIDEGFPNSPSRDYWNDVLCEFVEWFSIEEILMLMSWPMQRGEAGFPDLVGFDGESPFFVEVKAEGDQLRESQKECLRFITNTCGVQCLIVNIEDANADTEEYQAYFRQLRKRRKARHEDLRSLHEEVAEVLGWECTGDETLKTIRHRFRIPTLPCWQDFPEDLTPNTVYELADEVQGRHQGLADNLRKLVPEVQKRLDEKRAHHRKIERRQQQQREKKERDQPFIEPYSEGKQLEKQEGDLEAAVREYEMSLSRFEKTDIKLDISLQWLLASVANRYSITLKKLKRYQEGIEVIDRADALLLGDFTSSKWEAVQKRKKWLTKRLK